MPETNTRAAISLVSICRALQEELLETITAVETGSPRSLGRKCHQPVPKPRSMYRLFLTAGIRVRAAESAVAEALFGDYALNGKLPVTFYQGTENLPEFTDYSMAVTNLPLY